MKTLAWCFGRRRAEGLFEGIEFVAIVVYRGEVVWSLSRVRGRGLGRRSERFGDLSRWFGIFARVYKELLVDETRWSRGRDIPGGGCFDCVGEFFFESDDLILATCTIAIATTSR